MSKRSRSRRLLPVSLLVTLVTLALARSPILEQLYRGRKALQRKMRASHSERRAESQRVPEEVMEEAGLTWAMGTWEKRVTRFIHRTERRFDRVKDRVGERFTGSDRLMIVAYRGYGTAGSLFLKGRVLEYEGITPSSVEDSVWRNLINVYRRFETDEVPGAVVVARFQEQEYRVTTNEEGYFELWIEPTAPLPVDRLWHEIELELLEPQQEGVEPVRATGYVLVPPPTARFGVISDVDDTIVMTNATNLLKMTRTVFLGNAHTRVPFAGVAAFYEALQAGASGREFNPLFYVSSSPWNLYDLVTEFLEIQEIPLGPLMLRDWGISNDEVLPTKHAPHKHKSIRRILHTFPHLSFILIGDSGQEDPEIYYEIVHQFPDRIKAIYIRNVSQNVERPEAIRALATEVTEVGSTLVLTDDTLAAAEHAAKEGCIAPSTLEDIRQQVEADTVGEDKPEQEAPTIVIEGRDSNDPNCG